MTDRHLMHTQYCAHETVRFCAHCDVVYCATCQREWGTPRYTFWQQQQPSWPPMQPWYGGLGAGTGTQIWSAATPQQNHEHA